MKEQLLKDYAKFVKDNQAYPSRADLKQIGYTREDVRTHSGNLFTLQKEARTAHPSSFKGILDVGLFGEAELESLVSEVDRHKKFVLTTAVKGYKVDTNFLASLKLYCKKNDATLLILPASDGKKNNFLDGSLEGENIVFSELLLTNKIAIRGIDVHAKSVDPTTGTNRIGQRIGTSIFASPKQRLKYTATSNVKIPHAVMTTGAVTLPNYLKNNLNSKRDYLADHDHVMGAIIVELDGPLFHFRQVQADKQGRFADLGKLYSKTGTTNYAPEALVLGDWHSGETDPHVARALLFDKNSLVATTKPKRAIIHDGFNGGSISHHEIHNKLLRAQKARRNELDLTAEISRYGDDLMSIKEVIPELVIVKSNHDEFLDRYLAEGRYIEDAQNHAISLVLAHAMLNGVNPVRAGLGYLGFEELYDDIKWLDRDEDYKIADIELGAHGDRGANGSRGSLNTLEAAYGDVVAGHCLTLNHSVNVEGRGWSKLSDVKIGDVVLGYNAETKATAWTEVQNTIKSNYTGTLFEIGHNMWKQTVTDKHMMFTEDGEYVNILDAIAKVPLHKIPLTAKPAANSKIEGEQLPINFMRILTAVAADGSFDKEGYLRFHIKKQRKIDRLTEIFENAGIKLRWSDLSETGSRKCSIPVNSEIYQKITNYIGPKNKKIPELFRTQTIEFKEEFIRELAHWDGSYKIKSANGQQFSSNKLDEANLVQSIVNELGYRSSFLQRDKGSHLRVYVVTFNTNRESPIVSKYKDGSLTKWQVVPRLVKDEPTACLTTGTKNFWVRDDETGQVSLTGNSHTPQILRGAWQVGTTSLLKLEYNKGPSSWLHTSCLVYANGQRQLINVVDGKWRPK